MKSICKIERSKSGLIRPCVLFSKINFHCDAAVTISLFDQKEEQSVQVG